jgi:ATP adenylyltransferase
MMNLYPYNNGHLLIIPNRHLSEPTQLDDAELLEISRFINFSILALKHAIKPDGFNIGMNLARVAGAGVADHLHYHIVPRWNGDTNFMPILSETKVISQGLQESYVAIKAAFHKVLADAKA